MLSVSEEKRLQPEDRSSAWHAVHARVRLQPERPSLVAAEPLVAALQAVYANGRSEFASFLVSPRRALAVLAAVLPLSAAPWVDLLLAPAVAETLQPPTANAESLSRVTFAALPPTELASDITATLTSGGAYRSTAMAEAEARALAVGFCAELVNGREQTVLVAKSTAAWSDWFNQALWDRTWLGLDPLESRFWVLRATDID